MAPVAESTALAPAHTAVGEEEAVTVGLEITVMAMVLVPRHPAALVPDTV